MAETGRHRIGELQRGIFKILLTHPDGLQAKHVLSQLETDVPPTPFENSTYPKRPNVRRYDKIARFVTISPVKAGWMIKEKGQWRLTEDGRKAFEKYKDPELFSREARQLYSAWKKDQPIEEEELDIESEAAPETAAATLDEAEESAWAEVAAYLLAMPPYDFQNLVAGLLRGMGYHVSFISPPGADKGLDIVAHTDPLGINGPTIKVQVKRRQDRASVDALRGFLAVLSGSDVGLFVCTGGFTRDAYEEARGQQLRRIMLVDPERLFDLWIEHYARIPEEYRRLLPLKPIYYLGI